MVRSGGGIGLTVGGDERRHGISDICSHAEGQHQDSTDEEHQHDGEERVVKGPRQDLGRYGVDSDSRNEQAAETG